VCTENALLNRAEDKIGDRGERKGQFKANVAGKRTDFLRNRPGKPLLVHSHYRAQHTESESRDGSNANRELLSLIVVLGVVSLGAAAEDKVLGEADSDVNGEPISNWHKLVNAFQYTTAIETYPMRSIKSCKTATK
jgi:hypothetical protein